jgi:hyaluronan synthase
MAVLDTTASRGTSAEILAALAEAEAREALLFTEPVNPPHRNGPDDQLSARARPDLRRRRGRHGAVRPDRQVRVAPRKGPRAALAGGYDIPRIEMRRRCPWVWVRFAVLATAAGFARHVLIAADDPGARTIQALWAAGFLWMGSQWVLSWLDRPRKVTRAEQWELDRLLVVVNIPLYNEDPVILDRVLYALSRQTRRPNRIEVVDDGSTVDYGQVRDHWQMQLGTALRWVRQANGGKKHAQVNTFRDARDADIIVTIDSDTALEERALAEGLKPFADPRVQSVAGMETAANSQANWLTRTASARSMFFQLTACGVLSAMGEILVNRGAFALYRASLLREITPAYLEETFLGHRIRLGDDAALTLFARGRGRTVQQPSAWSFTMYPEKLSHHFRQWIRWMRPR